MPIKSLPLLLLACAALFAGDDFPAPINSEKDNKIPLMSASEAAAKFKVPDGFKVTLAAAEPDVQNPVAMAWDARGRLWVVENYTYAERTVRWDNNLRDRVLIFEDADHDGRFEKRTVFTDSVQFVTSVEIGHGGVWLIALPRVVFIPDRNKDDKPDGPPEVIFDGFDMVKENHHNCASGLRFGPDGWLYGRCGASSPGKLGLPGTVPEKRIPIHGGMWRYNLKSKVIEVLCHGTTNPWGHDWNEYGDAFFINTVNGHLWHMIPGAHYVRPHTIDPNPYVYEFIDQHADHFHYDAGKGWAASRETAGEMGGGHAHQGLMIYLGDNWPDQYRGKLFTLNFHGRRINMEHLERHGSGYVGKHAPDFGFAADPWFRGLDLTYGPDGGVYVIDYSDTGECHENTGVHRQSGRIFKIIYGDPKKPEIGDVSKLSAAELVKLHTHKNEWFVRQARLELAARAAAGESKTVEGAVLSSHYLDFTNDVVSNLNALHTCFAIGFHGNERLKVTLKHENEYVRATAIRLLIDKLPLDTITGERHPASDLLSKEIEFNLRTELVRIATEDKSPIVRLAVASVLQRLPVSSRAAVALALVTHASDAEDHNLPLAIWYGLIPVARELPADLTRVAAQCKIPQVRRLIARRLGEAVAQQLTAVNALLQTAAQSDAPFQNDILQGLIQGFAGMRKAAKPAAWDELAAKINAGDNAQLKERVRELSVIFGDGRALDEIKARALDDKAELNVRKAALETLIDVRPDDLRSICETLVTKRFINATAVKGLALFDDPAVGTKIVKSYNSFHPFDRPAAINTLVSRASFAKALIDEMKAGRIAKTELSPFQARQIRNFGDAELTRALAEVWGELREVEGERKQMMAQLKEKLDTATLAKADKSAGRAHFAKACATCHKLYGEGGIVGPDLTGAGRDNIDYLLENIVDPSAVVSDDFRMSLVALNDGRVLNGIVLTKTDNALTLQLPAERVTINQTDVKTLKPSTQSLMPEGLLETLKPDEVRDLFAYLMAREQVPLPAGKK